MLTAFRLQNRRLEQLPIAEPDALAEDAVWIDIVEPTAQERAGITRAYDVRLPDAEDMQEIEATARFYKDEDGLHIHSFFLDDFAETPTNVTVAFVLKQGRLFTLHEEELSTIRLFRLRARRQPDLIGDATSILLSLFETKVDRLADVLESVYTSLEAASEQVLRQSDKDLLVLLAVFVFFVVLCGLVWFCLLVLLCALFF